MFIAKDFRTALRNIPRFESATLFQYLAVVSLALALLTGAMIGLDSRLIGGEPIWLKPFKFAVSFAVLFGTYAAIVARLSDEWRGGLVLLGVVVTSAGAFLGEMAYISAQAARQEPSHFNNRTPYHDMMYGLMGVGSAVLMAGVAAIGVATLLDRTARLSEMGRLAIFLGAALTLLLTVWVTGAIVENGGRYVGVPAEGDATVPVFGWSLRVGDLRPAHFLSLHALQILPLGGWAVARAGGGKTAIWILAGVFAGLTVFVHLNALSGAPLGALPGAI